MSVKVAVFLANCAQFSQAFMLSKDREESSQKVLYYVEMESHIILMRS